MNELTYLWPDYSKYEVNAFGGGNAHQVFVGFDASRCNQIYGKSSTVQPPAIVTNFLIKY